MLNLEKTENSREKRDFWGHINSLFWMKKELICLAVHRGLVGLVSQYKQITVTSFL